MWLEAFSSQFAHGQPYPRWLTSTYAEFGSPTFYFYPPLTYFLGALISVSGLVASGSALHNTLAAIACLLSLTFSSRLLSDLGVPRNNRIPGTLLYAVGPYAFIDLFARSALSEYVALAWIPLLFIGALRILRDRSFGWPISTLAWLLLILTNIPATICAGIALVVFVVVNKSREKTNLIALGSAVAGVGLTCFYWLPAIRFSSLIRTDWYRSITSDRIDAIVSLLTHSPLPVSIAVGSSVLLIIGVLTYAKSRKQDRRWSSVLMAAILLQAPFISDLLYTHLFPFTLVQFAWRFGMILTLAMSILLTRDRSRLNGAMLLTLGTLTLGFYSAYAYNHFDDRSPIASNLRRDAPEYLTTFNPHDDSSTMALLRGQETSPVVTNIDAEGLTVESSEQASTKLTADLSTNSSGWIRLHQFYWPTWRVSFSDQPLQTRPDKDGMLSALLPAGRGRLEATIVVSNLEHSSALVSLGTLILVAMIQIYLLIQEKKK